MSTIVVTQKDMLSWEATSSDYPGLSALAETPERAAEKLIDMVNDIEWAIEKTGRDEAFESVDAFVEVMVHLRDKLAQSNIDETVITHILTRWADATFFPTKDK